MGGYKINDWVKVGSRLGQIINWSRTSGIYLIRFTDGTCSWVGDIKPVAKSNGEVSDEQTINGLLNIFTESPDFEKKKAVES